MTTLTQQPLRAQPLSAARGFTLMELLAVLTILAVLVTLATPAVHGHIIAAREAALRSTLNTTRHVIAQFYGDTGRYPDSLEELVQRKYLQRLPFDPIAQSAMAWVIEPPLDGGKGSVADLRSTAPGAASDGTRFGEW
ncbi:MAG: prepilin-type N-terminal cleavage/methylation domain-containing protein [Rubrivivax sp.]|nr:prepilin-type N-terminal cleavage/methylation domain-containing protein [Rubrivivax sp.]